jgi:hypothetical protein
MTSEVLAFPIFHSTLVTQDEIAKITALASHGRTEDALALWRQVADRAEGRLIEAGVPGDVARHARNGFARDIETHVNATIRQRAASLSAPPSGHHEAR